MRFGDWGDYWSGFGGEIIEAFFSCTWGVGGFGALSEYRTVGHGIVLYTSVQTWYSDSVQVWYSISFLSKYSTLKFYMKSIILSSIGFQKVFT